MDNRLTPRDEQLLDDLQEEFDAYLQQPAEVLLAYKAELEATIRADERAKWLARFQEECLGGWADVLLEMRSAE